MDKSRLEWKVGLFVFIGLVLLATLLLQFSKGTTFFRPTYRVLLHAENVGGLKPRAQVLMSGVQVGTVSTLQLGPHGTNVTITLKIYSQYEIYTNAHFFLEQSGFLGDQYVAVVPSINQGERLADGSNAYADAPLDLQKVARTAAGFLQHIDSAATNVNDALNDARHTILSPRALTNLSATLDNFHHVSERFLTIADSVNDMVETNRPAISASVSNLLFFSQQINQFADALRELLATNSPEIGAAVKNLETSSETVKNLVDGVQAGKGLAGKLLENEQIAANLSQIVSNLSITTSNLNRLGLWHILWQPKPPRTNSVPLTARPLTSPKNLND